MLFRRLLTAALLMLGCFTSAQAASSARSPLSDAELAPYAGLISDLRAQLPVAGQVMNDPAISAWRAGGSEATVKVVSATGLSTGPAGGQAISIAIPKAYDQPWAVTAHSLILAPIHKGDMVFLAVQVRASAASNESQSGIISALRVEETGEPYTGIADSAAQVGDTWQTVYAFGEATKDYPAGGAHIALQLGGSRQTLELGNAVAFNLGANIKPESLPTMEITYPGREATAPWRAAAAARIEKYRKGDLHIQAKDAGGHPLAGAEVRVEMTRQAFRFGSYIGHSFTDDTPKAAKMRDSFPALFNAATSPIYWQDWGWQNPQQRAKYIASMKYLHEHGFAWRAHTLIYPAQAMVPSYLVALSDDTPAFRRAVLDHVSNTARSLAPYRPFAMDVINEPRDGGYTTDRLGIDGIAEAFRLAKAELPDTELFVNEYGIIAGGGHNDHNISFYHEFIDSLLAAKAPLGGIGFQGHFGGLLTDPQRVYDIIDEFSAYKLPIEITEFDVDTNDQAAQADYTRDIMTIAFSHPDVDAFITWGWWAGDHWRPNAAMMDTEWRQKPSYLAWRKLVFDDWWTRETVRTDDRGEAMVRGFLGDYKVTVTVNGKARSQTVRLNQGGAELKF